MHCSKLIGTSTETKNVIRPKVFPKNTLIAHIIEVENDIVQNSQITSSLPRGNIYFLLHDMITHPLGVRSNPMPKTPPKTSNIPPQLTT